MFACVIKHQLLLHQLAVLPLAKACFFQCVPMSPNTFLFFPTHSNFSQCPPNTLMFLKMCSKSIHISPNMFLFQLMCSQIIPVFPKEFLFLQMRSYSPNVFPVRSYSSQCVPVSSNAFLFHFCFMLSVVLNLFKSTFKSNKEQTCLGYSGQQPHFNQIRIRITLLILVGKFCFILYFCTNILAQFILKKKTLFLRLSALG